MHGFAILVAQSFTMFRIPNVLIGSCPSEHSSRHAEERGKHLKFKNKPRSMPHADSGFVSIPLMWPAAVSKKEAFSGLEYCVTGGPVGAEIAMRW
jgi:hypothetical protein